MSESAFTIEFTERENDGKILFTYVNYLHGYNLFADVYFIVTTARILLAFAQSVFKRIQFGWAALNVIALRCGTVIFLLSALDNLQIFVTITNLGILFSLSKTKQHILHFRRLKAL